MNYALLIEFHIQLFTSPHIWTVVFRNTGLPKQTYTTPISLIVKLQLSFALQGNLISLVKQSDTHAMPGSKRKT